MSKITDIVSNIAQPVVEAEGCKLWDVEYVKEAGTWYLRVFIDKEDGVSIDDCERISRKLDPILDDKDPIPDSYIFEVGSAGADRVLKRESDFKAYLGYSVEVKLYKPINGAKLFTGKLIDYSDAGLRLSFGENEILITLDYIAQVRLHVDF